MMVRASIDVGIHDMSIYGWANIGRMTTSCLLRFLYQAAYLTDPRLWKMTYDVFIRGNSWPWPLQGRQFHSIPKRLRRNKKPSMRCWMEVKNNVKVKFWTFLVPILVFLFKVGCRSLAIMTSCCLREVLFITALAYTALSSFS
jgi:hypothetical protein